MGGTALGFLLRPLTCAWKVLALGCRSGPFTVVWPVSAGCQLQEEGWSSWYPCSSSVSGLVPEATPALVTHSAPCPVPCLLYPPVCTPADLSPGPCLTLPTLSPARHPGVA